MATKGTVRKFPVGRRTVVLVLALVAVTGLAYLSVMRARAERAQILEAARRQPFAPTEIVPLGEMPPELDESSGLGLSHAHPGVFWTHNDSGDEPRIYAIDEQAMLLATVDIEGVTARDWEAMTLGRCPRASVRSCLYAADIGDNRERREDVAIHVIEEPDPVAGDASVVALGTVRVRYPDGPRDAEGLAITSRGDLAIVTKARARPSVVFTLPVDQIRAVLASGETLTPEFGQVLPIEPDRETRRYVTGAAFTPADDWLVVRTYEEVFFFGWPLSPDPRPFGEACFLGELDPQGEAVAVDADGWLVLTSESPGRRRGQLHRVRCEP